MNCHWCGGLIDPESMIAFVEEDKRRHGDLEDCISYLRDSKKDIIDKAMPIGTIYTFTHKNVETTFERTSDDKLVITVNPRA